MAHHAIVIGINAYSEWPEDVSLTSAVADAQAVAAWLRDPRGGAVHDEHLTLLLAPAQGKGAKQGREPTRLNVLKCIEALDALKPGPDDRLYFYFAGHGMTFRRAFMDEAALLTSDFNDSDTTRSLGLRSLLERLEATFFRDQFIFIDACRDVPLKGELELGVIPRPKVPRARHPDIQQFVLHATSRRRRAMAIPGEGGFFTRALLAGLAGEGTAKMWDANTREYVVRFDQLFKFVKERVRADLLRAGAMELQAPQRLGQQGGGRDPNPVLARLPAEAFPKTTLEVLFKPRQAMERSEVRVYEGPVQVEQRAAPRALPVTFNLDPRPYHVEVHALGYQSSPELRLVELYEPSKVAFTLSAARVKVKPAAPAGALPPGTLSVQSSDSAAVIELYRSSGQQLRKARKQVVCQGLEPGYYLIRVRRPSGPVEEQTVLLPPGGSESVVLRGKQLQKGDVHVFEAFSLPSGPSATRTGLLLDLEDRQLEPRIWAAGAPVPSTSTLQLLGEGRFRIGLTEVRRGAQAGETLVLPAATLKERVYVLRLERQEGLAPRLSILYRPVARQRLAGQPEPERLSLALQRLLQEGRLDLADELLGELPAEDSEPMAVCLAAYRSARLERWEHVEALCQHAAKEDWTLPDFDVLRWHRERQRGNGAAADASFQLALGRGPPLVAEGLGLMAEALEPLPDEAPVRQLRHVARWQQPGLLFTAWRAPRFKPGEPLEEE